MLVSSASVQLTGERFAATYRLSGTESEARQKAADICLEQTVEFPGELVPPGDIRDQIEGRLESFSQLDDEHYVAVISYAVETSAYELPQLLNVLFGNISMRRGVRVERFTIPRGLEHSFRGPRFGREGLRARVRVSDRPLLCTPIKPMGLSIAELADLAHLFALGGIDVIKDDHGLTNQPFSTFRERVQRCAESVERANRETGGHCIYVPNVTAPMGEMTERALEARAAGAGGLQLSPGLAGFDAVRSLADDERLGLPILCHFTFLGSLVTDPDNGLSPHALFGQIARLAGADAIVFPHYGGRFSISREDCISFAEGTATPMGHIKPIFPTPAGGIRLDRIAETLEIYGRDVILLVGGDLHRHSADLMANCRHFRQVVEGANWAKAGGDTAGTQGGNNP